jgi:hypothetical protein
MSTLLRSIALAGIVALTGVSGALANTRDRDIAWKEYEHTAPATESPMLFGAPLLHEGRAATLTEPRVLHEGRAATVIAPPVHHAYVRPMHQGEYLRSDIY